jgi:hypothetical protein
MVSSNFAMKKMRPISQNKDINLKHTSNYQTTDKRRTDNYIKAHTFIHFVFSFSLYRVKTYILFLPHKSQRSVCDRSSSEIVGSNPARAWMSVVSVVHCQVAVFATS